jgi:hypothetical protein
METKLLLRAMAWHRAKGELYSMLETFENVLPNFIALENLIASLVNDVENSDLHR